MRLFAALLVMDGRESRSVKTSRKRRDVTFLLHPAPRRKRHREHWLALAARGPFAYGFMPLVFTSDPSPAPRPGSDHGYFGKGRALRTGSWKLIEYPGGGTRPSSPISPGTPATPPASPP